MYEIIARDKEAKRARFHTPHGTIETPVFMNVATVAAIKGAVSAFDLQTLKCQVALSNTYHLHVRTGEDILNEMGGVRNFMGWDGPLLTDSGGFQVFSLASLRKIKEEGVFFQSHIDGRHIFMGPEESIEIQSKLGSTIAMAFDECVKLPCDRGYLMESVDRTTRWLERSKKRLDHLNKADNTINKQQLLFGINQGGIDKEIRVKHAKTIKDMGLDGYAIGGLAVGETHDEMYDILEALYGHLPIDKPTYLMGVGTPENILEAVERGVDFFDCVLPARNGRHGQLFTNFGKMNITKKIYKKDDRPIDETCSCPVCQQHSRAYLRHLHKANEMLAMRLSVMHNLHFYNTLMEEIRVSIENGRFHTYKKEKLLKMSQNH